jgi:hypothetical protein
MTRAWVSSEQSSFDHFFTLFHLWQLISPHSSMLFTGQPQLPFLFANCSLTSFCRGGKSFMHTPHTCSLEPLSKFPSSLIIWHAPLLAGKWCRSDILLYSHYSVQDCLRINMFCVRNKIKHWARWWKLYFLKMKYFHKPEFSLARLVSPDPTHVLVLLL